MRKITKSHTLHRLYTIRIEFIMQLGSLYYYKFGTYIHVSHLAVIIKYDINKLIILQCFLEILSHSPKNKPLLLHPSSCTGIFTSLLSPPYATKIAVSAKKTGHCFHTLFVRFFKRQFLCILYTEKS